VWRLVSKSASDRLPFFWLPPHVCKAGFGLQPLSLGVDHFLLPRWGDGEKAKRRCAFYAFFVFRRVLFFQCHAERRFPRLLRASLPPRLRCVIMSFFSSAARAVARITSLNALAMPKSSPPKLGGAVTASVFPQFTPEPWRRGRSGALARFAPVLPGTDVSRPWKWQWAFYRDGSVSLSAVAAFLQLPANAGSELNSEPAGKPPMRSRRGARSYPFAHRLPSPLNPVRQHVKPAESARLARGFTWPQPRIRF